MDINHYKGNINRRKFIQTSMITASTLGLSPQLLTNCNTKKEDPSPVTGKHPDFTPKGPHGFFEGVASFDPNQHGIILWTRYTPAHNEEEHPEIFLDVAKDMQFTQVIVSEVVQIDPSQDYTIKADVSNLESNTTYYYKFRNELTNTNSIIGQTKTLPSSSEVADIKLAIVSCANYELGFFNVYEAIALSEANYVIHLGDYIYEGFKDNHFSERKHDPTHKLLSLDDYRKRYRQYRTDSQLQKAHQLKPFICIWDDHEFANNTYKDGASSHQLIDGDFITRKNMAMQAWHEYLPCRVNDKNIIFRDFDIGGIVHLMMLDTRLIGRDKQLDYNDYLSDNKLDDSFHKDWNNPERSLLGGQQKTWLIDQIQNSNASWQVLGNQVLMGKHHLPAELIPLMSQSSSIDSLSPAQISNYYKQISELIRIKTKIESGDKSVTVEQRHRVENVLPYNLDSWDGYPAEREQILSATDDKKLISFAGASHNAWHNELTDKNGQRRGTEFATASITSSGLEGIFGDNPVVTEGLEQANVLLMDDVKYSQISRRGYIIASFSNTDLTTEWRFVKSIHEKDGQDMLENKVKTT